jgi:hypothetical protein
MKTRTKRDLFLFVLSMGSLVGCLFHPIYHYVQGVKKLELLTIALQEKERNYKHLLESQRIYHLNTERIAVMEQDGFFECLDKTLLVERLHELAQNNKIHAHSIQIAEPVKDTVESSWSIIHWPVQVEFSGNSEEDIYKTIESLQKEIPGLVIPRDLVIIQKKRYAFWGKYGFGVVQTNHSVGFQVSEPLT